MFSLGFIIRIYVNPLGDIFSYDHMSQVNLMNGCCYIFEKLNVLKYTIFSFQLSEHDFGKTPDALTTDI